MVIHVPEKYIIVEIQQCAFEASETIARKLKKYICI